MAQDPEREEEQPREDAIDTSHELDMVPVYSSQTVDAEIEADIIRGILESNGVPAVIVGPVQFPVLGFEVQVPRARQEEAKRLIAEAQSVGPDGVAEAEAASEEGQ